MKISMKIKQVNSIQTFKHRKHQEISCYNFKDLLLAYSYWKMRLKKIWAKQVKQKNSSQVKKKANYLVKKTFRFDIFQITLNFTFD